MFGNKAAQNTKVIVHVDTSAEVADVINGHLITLPPNEPVELDTFIADAVIAHIGNIYGIVEVEQVRTKNGVVYKTEEALEKAAEYLHECQTKSVLFYVRQQMEDRIGAGKPALPPTGRPLQIILARKVNLRDEYGIVPVGWKDPNAKAINTGNESSGNVAPNVAALEAQLKAEQLARQETDAKLETLTAQLAQLTSLLQGGDEPGNEG